MTVSSTSSAPKRRQREEVAYWVARAKPPRTGGWPMRAFDILIALVVALISLPIMLVAAVAVRLEDGGPSIFVHERLGFGGRMFPCLKFRTMAIDAEARLASLLEADGFARREWELHHKLRNDPRITQVGRILRRTSVDELPQLLNILRGEMGVVGPRPLVLSEAANYGPRIGTYCRVRPGVTGLWQINGRNELKFRRRIAYDVTYVRNRSFLGDLWILLRTIPVVVTLRGSA